MAKKPSVLQVEELLKPILMGMDVELVDLIYRFENKAQILRLFIDKETGVTLELCTAVTKVVKNLLDEKDINYDNLEVSSPGLDRIIKRDHNAKRFIGEQVKARTLKKFSGPKNIVGVLTYMDRETITIENNDDSYNIPWDAVSNLRLHPDFV
ncbi:MAG TPA: ribosome maturation factor RimP [Syntrophomonadaceae bacterium]|nr:ribosome maturation factor RimP [Syntrophomonadaceae bacterium]